LYFEKAVGLYLLGRGDTLAARGHLEAYYKEVKHDLEVYQALLTVYLLTKDHDNSEAFAAAWPSARDGENQRLKVLADYYRSKDHTADADALDSLRR
jgi:hypothetical protein